MCHNKTKIYTQSTVKHVLDFITVHHTISWQAKWNIFKKFPWNSWFLSGLQLATIVTFLFTHLVMI